MMELLTYDSLRDVLRRQKGQTSLVQIPADFYCRAGQYIAEIRNVISKLEGKTDVFTLKRFVLKKGELENASSTLRDICIIRCNLILSMAWEEVTRNVPVSQVNFTPEEDKLFASAKQLSKEQWNSFEKLFSGQCNVETIKKEVPRDRLTVEIKTPLPAFVGTDLNTYGPYEGGEVVELPRKVAEMLRKQEKAVIGE